MKQSFITIFCILSGFASLAGHDQRDDSAAKAIETWVNPAFFKFIRDGNFFSVKQLLEATPAFNINDYERENSVRAWPLPNAHTAIETATQSGHADITRLLADRGANLIDALNTHNPAIQRKILDTLIKAGVNLNYQSPDTGWTPLIAATARSYPYLVERLLSLPSVDPTIKDNMGNTY